VGSGTPGYAELQVLADPGREDHHFRSWVGGTYDPAEFDVGLVNAGLQRVG